MALSRLHRGSGGVPDPRIPDGRQSGAGREAAGLAVSSAAEGSRVKL